MSDSLHTALAWLRLSMLMALPALGTVGLLLGFDAAPAVQLGAAAEIFGLGVVPVIVFVGFTASSFGFPVSLARALAVVLLTPALLLASTLLLGWGAWEFFVDECFAELGGMGLGAAAAALAYGGGGIGVRLLGAAIFGGGSVAALWLFGAPMLQGRALDPVWVGLNALALGWSLHTYFEIFAAHALRRRSADEAPAAAPSPERLRAPASLPRGTMVVLGIFGWIAALVITAVVNAAS